MSDLESIIRFLAPLGVGGSLAAFIFYFYRRDLTNGLRISKEDRDIALHALMNNTTALTEVRDSLREHTKAATDLQSFCRYREGNNG